MVSRIEAYSFRMFQKCTYINKTSTYSVINFFYLGKSDLLPVLEAEWKDTKGLSVLVKCLEGKVI